LHELGGEQAGVPEAGGHLEHGVARLELRALHDPLRDRERRALDRLATLGPALGRSLPAFAAVSAATSSRPFSTRETVETDTPAADATSRIVTLAFD
jgi:hypothetical protein